MVTCGKESGPVILETESSSVEEHNSCNTIWGLKVRRLGNLLASLMCSTQLWRLLPQRSAVRRPTKPKIVCLSIRGYGRSYREAGFYVSRVTGWSHQRLPGSETSVNWLMLLPLERDIPLQQSRILPCTPTPSPFPDDQAATPPQPRSARFFYRFEMTPCHLPGALDDCRTRPTPLTPCSPSSRGPYWVPL